MQRVIRLAPAAWLILLLAAPASAWLLGARQPPLEQSTRDAFPKLSSAAVRDPTTFKQLDAALLDRLPLRGQALHIRARVAQSVFGESPIPTVLLARDGWLFLRAELQTCDGQPPSADPADAVEIVARTAVASGRRSIVVIAGSKAVTERGRLQLDSRDLQTLNCVERLERAVQDRMASTPGGLDLRPALAAAKRVSRSGSAFLKYDTHWNGEGRTAVARVLLDAIRPGLARAAGVQQSERSLGMRGDLGTLFGVNLVEPIRRPTAARFVIPAIAPGNVVMVGDSQLRGTLLERHPGVASIGSRALPGAPYCSHPQLSDGSCDAAIRRSKTFLFQEVARDLPEFVSACWRSVSLLGESLHGTPSDWRAAEGQRAFASGSLLVGASGAITARIRPASGDVAGRARLLRIPVRPAPSAPQAQVTMTQRAASGLPSPCSSLGLIAPSSMLTLPVAAGQAASNFTVTIQAPPGTTLGRPEEVVLGGR